MELSVISRIDTYSGTDLSQAALTEKKRFRKTQWYKSLFQCLARNYGKGFLIGCTGWGIVSTSRALMGLSRGRKEAILPQIFNAYTAEWGSLLGGMLAFFNGAMYITAREQIGYKNDRELALLQRKKTFLDTLRGLLHHYRGAIAGAMCGLGMALGPDDRETRKTLALFMFIRAFEMEVRIWVEKGWLPNIPNADVLLMALSSSQVLWAWIMEPSANDPFYQTFLNRHGQKPRPIIDFLNDMFRGLPMDVKVRGEPLRANPLLDIRASQAASTC
jgi:hypothetical protein